MRQLERKYAREVVIIGVHAAKFPNEKDTEAVRQAILRLSIGHPVVNDRDFRVWKAYTIRAWPTITFVDPTGKVLAKLGDFDGIDKDGVPQGLLFPASPAFSLDGRNLYVTNLALDLRRAGSEQAIDSQWTDEVKRYTVSKLSTNFKALGQGH